MSNSYQPDRRQFIKRTATTAIVASVGASRTFGSATFNRFENDDSVCCDRTFATVAEAMASPPEKVAYVPAIYTGSNIHHPDYLATIDLDIESKTYGQIVHRLPMPSVGDELHHFGWNSCSSCHGQDQANRRFIILPGIASSRIHIVDTRDPLAPTMHRVIEPSEVKSKTGLSAPHTVHCLASGEIMISMLGDADGNAPGGFMLLDQNFEILGRWEKDSAGMKFNYDFWYQPRHNVMISSEWAAPKTVSRGFHPEEVAEGKYGKQLHFWDWEQRKIAQSIDLGEKGLIPLEVRFHHNPDSVHGFVGAALSSTIWHWHKPGDKWAADSVIAVESIPVDGWPFPVPGLITDLVLSLDDRYLYFSNWLHGDVRQYDVSDPYHPRLVDQIWLGGVLGKGRDLRGKKLSGGPQMLQLSLDGKRLYLTNSLYGPWDKQFYPDMEKSGSYLLKIDCDNEKGGMKLDESFFIDFGMEPNGPARAHEIRFATGDSTSDIWT